MCNRIAIQTSILLVIISLSACQSYLPPAAEEAPRSVPAMKGAYLLSPARALHVSPSATKRTAPPIESRERYGAISDGAVFVTAEQPVSTFAIDTDGGAYANVRRLLRAGQLPPHDAVRIEEMVNYFPFDLPRPAASGAPFAVSTEMSTAPWNSDKWLLRIGIKGRDIAKDALPPANLVFLIDVSGSMGPSERLPLIKASLKRFVQELRPQDSVSIVTYADEARITLSPASGNRRDLIEAAIDNLQAGGSTNGGSGISMAYELAHQNFQSQGINRVLLATDGDFNVGETSFATLRERVARERKTGISLSTLGVGRGNYNEHLMEQLADSGDGHYSYLDTLNEGYKVLIDEFTSTLDTIARDVKIQVEFNPAVVGEYRLIGYENRLLRREDFKNAAVDAGEIGAGHTVTAIYELTPAGSASALIEPNRYASKDGQVGTPNQNELAHLRIRYLLPEGGADADQTLALPILKPDQSTPIDSASNEHRFAAAVAAFGQVLRGGRHTGQFSYREISTLAGRALGADRFGYRKEFLGLVARACRLTPSPHSGETCPGAPG